MGKTERDFYRHYHVVIDAKTTELKKKKNMIAGFG